MLRPNRSVIVIFLGPAVLCYVLVFLYPTLRTLVMSFFAVESVSDPVAKWTFAGLANYIKIFSTPFFLRSMNNIGRIWLFGGFIVMFTALLFAIILTNNTFGVKFFKSVIYLPNVVSAVAMGTMWIMYVYNTEYGLLRNVFSAIGLTGLSETMWTGPGTRFWSMLAAYCFGMVGYHMLIFISGIEQIPRDFYEAALLEGASPFQRFIHVTLPNIKGVIRTNIVMWTVFTVGFFIWSRIFSQVNLSNDTVTPMTYMYELVFGASSSAITVRDSGSGAAIGVVQMLMVVAVFAATMLIVRHDDTEV